MRFEHFVIQGGLEKAIVEINKGVQYTLDDKFEDARTHFCVRLNFLVNAEHIRLDCCLETSLACF